ncbi:DUF1062 domain-containing protein [Pelagibius sp.]|uniref:DUF1062 domain-containing protein n=1 Tax=Pelagibius sp. TaxID=1931238 RepID=UPI00262907AE|nr:DUF1062 domain-containing protein [Pelagibius sp.]
MGKPLSVLWTITPQSEPRPWLTCSRCGGPRPFRSSGKFRLNANGKRLDAWLIYCCAVCDQTWNRPVLERRTVASLDLRLVTALRMNDPGLARRMAFDLDGLSGHAGRIEHCNDLQVHKTVLAAPSEPPRSLEIRLAVPDPVRLRLDRLLAGELGLARQRLQNLEKSGRLALHPARARMLRRPLRDGLRLTLDLSQEPDGAAIAAAAQSSDQ